MGAVKINKVHQMLLKNNDDIIFIFINLIAKSAGAVEYTDRFSREV